MRIVKEREKRAEENECMGGGYCNERGDDGAEECEEKGKRENKEMTKKKQRGMGKLE